MVHSKFPTVINFNPLIQIMFVICSFNKKEDDFENLNEYNDYLEMIETIGKYNTCVANSLCVWCINLHGSAWTVLLSVSWFNLAALFSCTYSMGILQHSLV